MARSLKKQIRCRAGDGRQPGFRAACHDHFVVNTQRNTETIKAGAEIRSARRNANRNLLHRSAVELCTRRSAMRECSAPGPGGNRSVAHCRFASMPLEITAANETEIWMD